MQDSKKNHSRKLFIIVAVVLLLLTIVVLSYIVITKLSHGKLDDVKYVTKLVANHVVLPSDETPALITVTNPTKLTTSFLKKTKQGDKVLVYQIHKRAIIYRPSIDKIIDIGPVMIDTVKVKR